MVTAFYPIAVTTQRNIQGVLMSLVLILNRRHIVLAANDVNETNNPDCDTGPNDLSEAFGMDVPRTCIDFKGAQRCYYTLIPPTCETPEDFPAPLVIDNHAGMSCPLYSAGYTGWADIALTKECLIVVWPTGILDPNISSDWSCFGVPGGATLPVEEEEEQDISIERNQEGFASFTCCCSRDGYFIDDATDSPDFLRAVIEDVVTLQNENSTIVDPKRIYMAGHL